MAGRSSRDFTEIPILDYSLSQSAETKPLFLSQLQHALINVGFLYLRSTPVPQSLTDSLVSYIPKFFALPQEDKDAIAMVNSPHFLGYSSFGKELTKGKVDQREQVDIATPHETRWHQTSDPDYWRLWGRSQFPTATTLPGFKEVVEAYLKQVQTLADGFITLFAEALGLGPRGLNHFYDTPEKMQHRCKLVKYPPVRKEFDGGDAQGVGPHFDAGFVTILLQASDHRGLQVQNLSGQWIDVPPIPGTFVINFGRALEFATQGVARATSHRVVSPSFTSEDEALAATPRYSVPFFHNIGLDVKVGDKDHVLSFPDEILKLRDARGTVGPTDSVNFSEFDTETSGKVNLIGRIKSHPDVGQRHYPELFKKYFPEGLPAWGIAY